MRNVDCKHKNVASCVYEGKRVLAKVSKAIGEVVEREVDHDAEMEMRDGPRAAR